MALTLIQNVALIVMLAAIQRYVSRRLVSRPRIASLASGLLYGAVAVVGMMTPFRMAEGIIYDGRSIVLALAGLFGGAPVAVVAALIAGAYRASIGGAGALAGVTTIAVSAALGVAYRSLAERRPAYLRLPGLLGFGVVVHIAMLAAQYTLLPGGIGPGVVAEIGPVAITLFPLGTVLASRLIIEQKEREQAQLDLAHEADAAESRAAEAELLARASADLLACRDRDGVFGIIRDFMAAVLPNDIVIVNEVTPDGQTLVTRDVTGVDHATVAQAERLTGYTVIGKRFGMTPEYRALFLSGRLEVFEGGLVNISESELPRARAEAVARTFGIRGMWTMGIADAGMAYAVVNVLVKRPGAVPPTSVVESFAHLCFVTLARIEAADRLAASDAQQARLFENMSEGLALCEAVFDDTGRAIDFRYLRVNHAFERMAGIRSADLIGKLVGDVAPQVPRERIELYGEVARTGVPARLRDVSIDGDREHEIVVYSPLEGQFAVIVSDVTERKAAERALAEHREHLEELIEERTAELARANTELETANAELQRATAAKSAFLASMSHELRTPLNSIIGFSSLLRDGLIGPLTPEQAEKTDIINRSGRHLLALINDILDLEKIEAGKVEVHAEEFSAHDLVRELSDMVAPLVSEKGLELRVAADGAVVLMSDPAKVRQILLNLLSNAIKFTNEGGVKLRLEHDTTAGTVAFHVSDTGPGIAEEDQRRVFERFTQIQALGDVKPSGTGLGLALSREYAHLLGGTLSVTSAVGSGSTFTLTLPA
jgi:PAS domain S-box-containing protein